MVTRTQCQHDEIYQAVVNDALKYPIPHNGALAYDAKRGKFSNSEIDYDTLAHKFAELINEQCCSHDGSDEEILTWPGGVIALCGSWGSGKTSFINATVAHLSALEGWGNQNTLVRCASEKCDHERILYFDPWLFSSYKELVLQFFVSLYKKYSKSENAAEIQDKISKYGDLAIRSIPSIAGALSDLMSFRFSEAYATIADVAEKSRKASEPISDRWTESSLLEAKGLLSESLKKEGVKSRLVIIDNIDRLSDSEIQQVFRFIGSVVNLPNVVYLLSCDRDIVVRALEGLQRGSGEYYLDKIVGVSFSLPPLDLPSIVHSALNSNEGTRHEVVKKETAAIIAMLVHTPRMLWKILSETKLDAKLVSDKETFCMRDIMSRYLLDCHEGCYWSIQRLSESKRYELIQLVKSIPESISQCARALQEEMSRSSSVEEDEENQKITIDEKEGIESRPESSGRLREKVMQDLRTFLDSCGLNNTKEGAENLLTEMLRIEMYDAASGTLLSWQPFSMSASMEVFYALRAFVASEEPRRSEDDGPPRSSSQRDGAVGNSDNSYTSVRINHSRKTFNIAIKNPFSTN